MLSQNFIEDTGSVKQTDQPPNAAHRSLEPMHDIGIPYCALLRGGYLLRDFLLLLDRQNLKLDRTGVDVAPL